MSADGQKKPRLSESDSMWAMDQDDEMDEAVEFEEDAPDPDLPDFLKGAERTKQVWERPAIPDEFKASGKKAIGESIFFSHVYLTLK